MKKISLILTGFFATIFLLFGFYAYADDATIPNLNPFRVSSGYIIPNNSANGLKIPALSSSGSCLITDGSGVFSTSTCGSGGSGSITTSTAAQIGKLPVWTGLSTLGNSMLFSNGTVSGVNATTSSYTFNVQATAGVSPFQVTSSSGASLLFVDTLGNLNVATLTASSLVMSDTAKNLASVTLGTGLSLSGRTLNASNSFTGSGTNGFVTRWTSSSNLSTGILLDNASVAGVNATSASYTFNVQGGAGVSPFNVSSSTGNSLLTVTQAGAVGVNSSTPVSQFVVVGSGATSATSALTVTNSSGLPIFLLRNDGFVLFGTTTPATVVTPFTVYNQITAATSARIAESHALSVLPATNASGNYQGMLITAYTDGLSTVNFNGPVSGLNVIADHRGSGNDNGGITAGFYYARNNGPGLAASLVALNPQIYNIGTGTTTLGTAINIPAPSVTSGALGNYVGLNIASGSGIATNTSYSILAADSVGIGTTTTAAMLDVYGANNLNPLNVSSSSKISILKVTANNHISTNGTSPTISACGSTPNGTTLGKSNDIAGRITIGGGVVTSCTVTFKSPYTNTPVCIAQDESGTLALQSSSTPTTITITSASTMGGASVVYRCTGLGE